MTLPPANSNDSGLPVGLDESDLLALVEGTPMPAERAARLREALAHDPRLAELAALMRADRDTLASLPTASAPADLLDRVEVLLEREALVGLAHTEASAVGGDLPVSTVIPMRRPWVSLRVGAPLAAAAAVLLIAGGVLMLIPGKRPPIAPPIGPTANNDTNPRPGDLAHNSTPDKTGVEPVNAEPPRVPTDVATKTNPDAPVAVDPNTAPAVPVIAKTVPTRTIPTEELLAAARDGRLVLRLRTPDDAVVTERIKAARGNTQALHIQGMSTDAYIVASGAYKGGWKPQTLPPDLSPRPDQPAPAPLANSKPDGTPPVPSHVTNTAAQPRPTEPDPVLSAQAFIASVPATAQGLEALFKLRSEVVPGDWQILPEPMKLQAPAEGETILWWASSPSAWSPRFTVPILVQSN